MPNTMLADRLPLEGAGNLTVRGGERNRFADVVICVSSFAGPGACYVIIISLLSMARNFCPIYYEI